MERQAQQQSVEERQTWLQERGLLPEHVKNDANGAAYVELVGNDGLIERVYLPTALQD